jgi:hypothetical protein
VAQNVKGQQPENGGMYKKNVRLNIVLYKVEIWGSD